MIKSVEGGEIKLGTGVSLVIPPNSLSEDTNINILDENIIIDEENGTSARIITFEPTGLVFSSTKPAKFVFNITEGLIEDYDLFYTSDKNQLIVQNDVASKTDLLPITPYSNTKGGVDIEHFSKIYFSKSIYAYLVFALPSEYLNPGDILYSMSPKGSLVGWLTGHGALYIGGDKIIQSVNSRWNQKKFNDDTSKFGAMDTDLGGVDEDNFSDYEDWYYKKAFTKQYPFVGAMRHKDLTSTQQKNDVLNFAKEKIGEPYALVGNTDGWGYSCVGLIEQAFEEAGLNIANISEILANAVLPVNQWSSGKLNYVNTINIEQGKEINIPIYGLKRVKNISGGYLISTHEPYAPSKTSWDHPPFISWNSAKCKDIAIEGNTCEYESFLTGHTECIDIAKEKGITIEEDTCKHESFVPGYIGGEVPLDASIDSYYIEFDVDDRVRRTLIINVIPKTPKPITHYSFDNDTATQVTDDSGNGNEGTPFGNLTYQTGISGQAVSFDGVDDEIIIGHSNIFDLNTFTISGWVFIRDTSSTQEIFFKDQLNNFNHNFGLYINNGQIITQLQNGSQQADLRSSTLTVGWHHIVFSSDGANSHKFYMDGVPEDSSNMSWTLNGNTLDWNFGSFSAQNTFYFDGLIDEVKIYDRALSDAEIQEFYQQDSNNINTLFFDDFENETVGQIPSQWANGPWSDAGTNYVTDAISSTGNHSAHVSSFAYNQKGMYVPNSIYQGDQTLEFDFYLPAGGEVGYVFGASTYAGISVAFKYIGNDEANIIVRSGSTDLVMGVVSTEQWHHFKAVFDWQNSQVTSIADNTLIGTIPLTKYIINNFYGNLAIYGDNQLGPRTVYFDNVSIKSNP